MRKINLLQIYFKLTKIKKIKKYNIILLQKLGRKQKQENQKNTYLDSKSTKLQLQYNFLSKFNQFINILIFKMQKQLSEQKIAQFKQAFQLFDKDNDNLVQVSQLPLLVRSLYQTPTEQQLSKWMKQIDPKNQGKFQFAEFLALMASQYKEPQTEDQLIEAMHSIFKPKGPTITIKQFKNVMTNLGQKLTEDQLSQLFKQLKMEKQDSFNYEQFIRTILTR